jgi:hypothetical protein
MKAEPPGKKSGAGEKYVRAKAEETTGQRWLWGSNLWAGNLIVGQPRPERGGARGVKINLEPLYQGVKTGFSRAGWAR